MKGRGGLFIEKFRHNSLTEQRTSGNPSIRPVVRAHRSKGCLVCPGITQGVYQKVVYVRWSHVRPVYYLQSVRPLDLAYVLPLWVSVKLLSKCDQVKLRVLGFRLSDSTKGSGLSVQSKGNLLNRRLLLSGYYTHSGSYSISNYFSRMLFFNIWVLLKLYI
jgi:hypothetical protein